jgi:hypothetical protein
MITLWFCMPSSTNKDNYASCDKRFKSHDELVTWLEDATTTKGPILVTKVIYK